MEQKAMEQISARIGEVLCPHGFTVAQNGNAKTGTPALFLGEATAYALDYVAAKKLFVLKSTTVSEGALGSEWKNLSSWLFDAETNTLDDAASIANDFADTLTTATTRREAAVQQQKKRKEKGDEHYVDPGFLMRRFVNIFPELRAVLSAHRDVYGGIAPHILVREDLMPIVHATLADLSDIDRAQKFFEVLNVNYANGDLDTKSVITIGILNALETPRELELAEQYLDEKTKKAWDCAKKYKNKKVRPEKVKKAKVLNAEKSLGSLK